MGADEVESEVKEVMLVGEKTKERCRSESRMSFGRNAGDGIDKKRQGNGVW